jgi:hypothetical protein
MSSKVGAGIMLKLKSRRDKKQREIVVNEEAVIDDQSVNSPNGGSP